MTTDARLLLVAPLLLVAAACSDGSEDALLRDLGTYLNQVDTIDAKWRSDVETAYKGREYLATGDLPDGVWTSSEVLRDVISNLEDLVAATERAVSSARGVEPLSVAAAFHTEWMLLLDDLSRFWTNGLDPLRNRDFEQFMITYRQASSEEANLDFRMNLIGQDATASLMRPLDASC
jgi:hypothetical protein